MVGPLEAHDARLVVAGRPRHPGPGHEDEAGLVVGVVLDVLGHDHQAVALGCQPRGDGGLVGPTRLADGPGRIGGRVGGPLFGFGQLPGQVLLALRQRVRIGGHDTDVRQGCPGPGHEVEVDVHDHLALDVQVHVVDQAVDGGAHRAFDRVLHGHEPEIDRSLCHRLEHGGNGAEGVQLGPGQVRLGEQRLLGERGGRAEVRDGFRRRGHSWAG